MRRFTVLLLTAILGPRGSFAQAPSPPITTGRSAVGGEALARVSRAVAGRMASVEVVEKADGSPETIIFESSAVVIGPRHILSILPADRLPVPASVSGAIPPRVRPGGADGRASRPGDVKTPARTLRALIEEPGGSRRRVPAQLIQSDPQTGLVVLQVQELRGSPLTFNPTPVLARDEPVVLVIPGDGRPQFLPGRLRQMRAHLDQGKGKNPLILFKLDDDAPVTPRSTGAILADAQGGFLGIVTPPSIIEDPAADPSRQAGAASGTPGVNGGRADGGRADGGRADGGRADGEGRGGRSLKDGELFALPAEIARLLADSLARGRVPERGYFGASFREAADPPEDVRRLGSALPGVRVEKVYPGGPADQGGLRPGDWLVAVAEKKGITYPEVVRFSELVEYGGQGRQVLLQVAREADSGHSPLKLRIQIGKR